MNGIRISPTSHSLENSSGGSQEYQQKLARRKAAQQLAEESARVIAQAALHLTEQLPEGERVFLCSQCVGT